MKVLFVGESWIVHETHQKGFDVFTSVKYEEGGRGFIKSLEKSGAEVDYMPCHVAQHSFPNTLEALLNYDVVILSDIGSNTLLLHDDTFRKGKRRNNALMAIKDYVKAGGGFAMMGGYLSFQGIDAKAKFAGTVIEEILPIKMMDTDDRYESPEGIRPEIINENHPILNGVSKEWPHFLGYNILKEKANSNVIAKCGNHVFMASCEYGEGRSFVFASDIAPHWGSPEFVEWESYDKLFGNMLNWLSK